MSSEKARANSKVESPSPFTEGGKCFDEVQFIFDDQQNLVVSQNFLILASPVFEAMFKSDFKEKQTMTVHLKGKIYEDFLEFLMCIHPGGKTTVTTSNVLRISPIAEEYQVARVIHKCTKCMKTWLI
ncbi:BTB and MATH domain-containing protein 38-like [Mercenaria mercenaria]|uniref:BTB and MATH domain-containing protein 38-like n=1 Tax=Mercenaria mercenaria TaxID=6596 RepID=UPI00234E38B2|nr:BTB and MATH domain-containing protein 38-like [Mercenaria mercenaria]